MNHAELRAKAYTYFQAKLNEAIERRSELGTFSEEEKQQLLQSIALHEMPNEDLWKLLGGENARAEFTQFCEGAGISQDEHRNQIWAILDEIRKAKAGAAKALLEYGQSLEECYDFSAPQSVPEKPFDAARQSPTGPTLNEAVEAYFTEHEKTAGWTAGTIQKRRAGLDIALEWFGPDIAMNQIGKKEAAGLKDALLSLPVNRSKVAATRGLPLREAIKVQGVESIGNATVNSYLSTYKNFWAWAEAHGYAPEVLFDGMKVSKKGGTTKDRAPFTQEALEKTYNALTDPSSKFYKKESYRWATLIAMYSGARQNEICQLQLKDIKQVEDIWVIEFTEEGEENKRLKSSAARRTVPVHSHLIELGLLNYHARRQAQGHDRLFPDFTYSPKAGYGDKLSKWFNRTFTKNIGIKSDAHVFHGLRHTFATRLGQADVQTERIQFIIGHERQGVTHQVYMKEGYTLQQTRDAVERFSVC